MDTTSPKFNFDQNEWVVRIRTNLDEELEDEPDVPVSIFNVPKPLMISHPYTYLPQQIAIGPYHYFSPEHYEMERYKVAAAKRIQKENQNQKFHSIVDQFKSYDRRIRAHYHRYLALNSDTLAWIMAMDAAFLLEFLRVYAEKEGTALATTMSHFIDSAGTKCAHNAILRDIVMVENQIPLFLLRKVLEFQFSSLESADTLLIWMLMGLYEEINPFKNIEQQPNVGVIMKKSAHLLDFLYHAIVPKFEEPPEIIEVDQGEQDELEEGEGNSLEESSKEEKNPNRFWKALCKLDKGPAGKIKRILITKPFKVLVTVICNFPGIRMIKEPMENMLFPENKEEGNSKMGNIYKKPPRVEEINIPSVTKLAKSGVCFVPTYKGISGIKFDVKTKKFYLPTIYIDVNSEVVLRNLVAYETCNTSGELVFTRYTELMNGIIDTEDDVKFLREKGIIVNHLNTDTEVMDLCNGMNKSIKLTKVDLLDKTIRDVNEYHNGRWTVKFEHFMKEYVFGSWKFLTLLAAVFMLFLMALQAFCSIYSCPRALGQVENLQ